MKLCEFEILIAFLDVFANFLEKPTNKWRKASSFESSSVRWFSTKIIKVKRKIIEVKIIFTDMLVQSKIKNLFITMFLKIKQLHIMTTGVLITSIKKWHSSGSYYGLANLMHSLRPA